MIFEEIKHFKTVEKFIWSDDTERNKLLNRNPLKTILSTYY